jgi:hypothetical protein
MKILNIIGHHDVVPINQQFNSKEEWDSYFNEYIQCLRDINIKF